MKIIELTDFANEKTKYYVNAENIDCFYVEDESEAVTDVCTAGNCFRVKETPKEIEEKISDTFKKPFEEFMGFSKKKIEDIAKEKGISFQECLFLLYFYNNISISDKDRSNNAGIEMYKKFAKATVKVLGILKESQNGDN